MLTRRNFLKLIAVLFGNVAATACARALETLTPAPTGEVATATPKPTASATATPTATASATATATATATPTPTSTATSTPIGANLATIRGDQFYLRGERFPIKGFNYYPRLHPWRTFNVGEWEPKVTEYELRLGASLGANVVRIFVDYNFSVDLKTPQPTPTFLAPIPQYIANVRECLDLAERSNLQVIVTLFDSLDWAIYQPQNRWIAEEYLKAFLPAFVNDPRILCWDLQNEPDKAIRTLGKDIVIPFFQRLSLLARSLDRNHLQTIGWIDRARGLYLPDLTDYLDFWCFHFYDKAERLPGLAQFYKSQTTKPILLEEFGLATGGPGPDGQNTEFDQVAHYDAVLNTLEANNLCGSVLWALTDFPIGLAGNPPIQTDSPENHYGVFRVDYTEKPVAALLRDHWRSRKPTPQTRMQ